MTTKTCFSNITSIPDTLNISQSFSVTGEACCSQNFQTVNLQFHMSVCGLTNLLLNKYSQAFSVDLMSAIFEKQTVTHAENDILCIILQAP